MACNLTRPMIIPNYELAVLVTEPLYAVNVMTMKKNVCQFMCMLNSKSYSIDAEMLLTLILAKTVKGQETAFTVVFI